MHDTDKKQICALSTQQSNFVVFIAGTLCFANSIWAGFAYDDAEVIIRNKDVLGETNITQLFHNDFWGHEITSNLSHKSYRPLAVISLRWNYYLAGGFNPMTFHAINIVLFGILCILQLQVFHLLSSTRNYWSLLAGVLFAVHPIHTECVRINNFCSNVLYK